MKLSAFEMKLTEALTRAVNEVNHLHNERIKLDERIARAEGYAAAMRDVVDVQKAVKEERAKAEADYG